MDHLITWPNFYKKGETYLDFKWDLTDILDQVENIKSKKNEFNEISLNGHINYNKYTSGVDAGNYFLNRIKNLLNE